MKEFSKEFLQVVNGPVHRDTNSALGPVVVALIDDGKFGLDSSPLYSVY